MSTNIGTLTAILEADASRLNGTLTAAQMSFARFEAGALKAGKGVTSAFNGISLAAMRLGGILAGVGITAGLIGLAKATTSVGMDLEHMLTVAGAVMRATEDEMRMLEKTAKQMGATTEYSSAQAAQALKYLGQAGFSATESVKALPGVLNLATAGNIGLAESADIAAAVLRSMQMPVEQLSRVNDVFVATINRSSTEIVDLAEAFKYVAPVASAYGYSLEEVAAMLGKLGDAGIRGSMAGTNLAMSMQRAYAYSKEMRLESGKFIDVLEHLMKSGREAKDVIPGVFDIRSSRAALNLAEMTDEVRAFIKELQGTQGEALRLAQTMRGTLKMQFKELQSAIESVAEDAFARYRDRLWDAVWSTIDWIRSHKADIVAFVESVTQALTAVGWALKSFMEILGGGLKGATAFTSIKTEANGAKTAIEGLAATKDSLLALGDAAKKAGDDFSSLRKAAEKKPEMSGWIGIRDILDALVAAATMAMDMVAAAIVGNINALIELFNFAADNIRALVSVGAAAAKVFSGIGNFDNRQIKQGVKELEEAFKRFRLPRLKGFAKQITDELGDAWRAMQDKISSVGIKAQYGVQVDYRSLRAAEGEIREWKDKVLAESGRAPVMWQPPVEVDWSKIVTTAPPGEDIVKAITGKIPDIRVPVNIELSHLGSTVPPDLAERIEASEDSIRERIESGLRSRLEGMKRLEEINYQARLAMADEFDSARFKSSATFSRQMLEAERQYRRQSLELDRWYAEQKALFPDSSYGLQKQIEEARLELETTYSIQRAEIAKAEQEQLVSDWLASHDLMIQASNQFTSYWVENALRGGGTWREAIAQVGQAIVSSLAGQALTALWNFIAGSATATAAQTTLAATTTAATAATATFTAASSSATAAQTALAVATGATATTTGVLTAASVAATTAQTVETASVVALTGSYVALAAAKEAAAAAGGAAAAAGGATIVFGVVNILEGLGGLFGFDNPANDAVAFRHGSDYMREFMAGARKKAAAPAFGTEVNAILSQAAGTAKVEPMSAEAQTVTVHNHFEGVVSEDFQRETVQLTGRASKRRQVKLYSVTDPRFGGSLALGGI